MQGGGAAEHEEEQKKERWWEDCSPDCGDALPDCTPDCDCVPCDLGLFMLSWMAVTAPTRPARRKATTAGRAGMAAIRGYQRWLSPRLPTRCRHTPTCSAYGLEAVGRYGLVAGSRLTAGRLRRCKHPTPRGTFDPVP